MWKPVDAPVKGVRGRSVPLANEIMNPASADGMAALPNGVLIVEDDPIIALDFEETILGFGVKTVRDRGKRGQGARNDSMSGWSVKRVLQSPSGWMR